MTLRFFSLISAVAVCACTTNPTESLLGAWRSENLNLRVTRDSTQVWGGCSLGTIPGPLAVSADGRFEGQFDFVFFGGAAGGNAITTRMLLSGTLDDDRLLVALDAMGSAPPVVHRLQRGEGQPYLPCPARAEP